MSTRFVDLRVALSDLYVMDMNSAPVSSLLRKTGTVTFLRLSGDERSRSEIRKNAYYAALCQSIVGALRSKVALQYEQSSAVVTAA